MTLIISASLWQQALEELRIPPHNRERVAYLDGPKTTGPLAVATTLTIPNSVEHEGYFDVLPEEMSRAGRHLKAFNMRRLAQIHTHPFGWVGHSEYDDRKAFSQREGAISIVVPHFAGCAPGPSECGLHLRGPSGWQELTGDERADLITIVPTLIDMRP
jgi:hypothetical protein